MVAYLGSSLTASSQSEFYSSDPVSLNSTITSKLLVKKEKPKYPPLARINFIQGQVRLNIRVSSEGRVTGAHVLHGHPFLAAPALVAVRRWLYRPYRSAHGAVPFSTLVDFNFELRASKLTPFPPAAEKDLQARVTPPVVLDRPGESSPDHVRLRVLVDSEGRAIDSQLVSGRAEVAGKAQEGLAHWTFRPAHWGALAVPWYLDIDVAVPRWPEQSGAADPQGM